MGKKRSRVPKNQMRLFDIYNYEATFDTYLSDYNKQRFEDLRKIIGQGYTTKTIKSGNQFEIEIYPHFKRPLTDYLSKTIVKKRPSSKEQRILNNKNSRKMLERLIHCNFTAGDYWGTFTFDDANAPDDLKRTRQLFKNAVKRINRKRKNLGFKNAKYIYVTEKTKKGRWHIHFLMDGALDIDFMRKVWKLGYSDIRKINYRGDEDLIAIAKYMSKDAELYPEQTPDSDSEESTRRWDRSKGNLAKPEERKNKSKFSKKQVIGMATDQNSIQQMLEANYKNYNFKNAEVRFNEFNGLFYIHARMQDKRNQRIRI